MKLSEYCHGQRFFPILTIIFFLKENRDGNNIPERRYERRVSEKVLYFILIFVYAVSASIEREQGNQMQDRKERDAMCFITF